MRITRWPDSPLSVGPLCVKTTKKLILHSLRSFWAVHDLGHDVRTRREIMLQIRLSKALHIHQYRLAKMPTKKLISRSKWIVEKGLVKMTTSEVFIGGLRSETYNFVIILFKY